MTQRFEASYALHCSFQAKEMSLRFLRVTEEHHAVETYTMVAVNDRGTTEKDTYLTDGKLEWP